MVSKLLPQRRMETTEEKRLVKEKASRAERRELLEHLAALDRALERLDCRADVSVNLAAAHHIGYCCGRLETDLARRLSLKEQIDPALASSLNPEMGEFTEHLRAGHEELRRWLGRFARALEQFAAKQGPYEAVCEFKEEGQRLVREMARHVALEESELAGFL